MKTDTRSLLCWLEEVSGLSGRDFGDRHPCPVLIPQSAGPSTMDEKRSFATERIEPGQISAALLARQEQANRDELKRQEVLVVASQSSGLFDGVVSVGRAASNDLVVDVASVSKFHAYFSQELFDDSVYLTDAGSTNGTFLNGKRLPPREQTSLMDGDLIAFTEDISFRFHTAEGFYRKLNSLAALI